MGIKLSFINSKWFIFILLIFVFFVFSDTLNYDFIYNWDDNVNVTENQYIKNLSFEGIKTLFSQSTSILEPRFTLFTYAIEYHFFKLHPASYHLVNILLHLLNILLIYFLIKKLSKDKWSAIFCAILFGIHPMKVESVAWITGRKDLLFTAFYLLSMLCYVSYIQTRKIYLFFVVVGLGYLSYLSKIQALTLPLVLFLLDYFYKRKFDALMILEKIFLLLLLLNFISIPRFGAFSLLVLLWYFFLKIYDSQHSYKDNFLQFKGIIFIIGNVILMFFLFNFIPIIGFVLLILLVWLVLQKIDDGIYRKVFLSAFRTNRVLQITSLLLVVGISVFAVIIVSQKLQFWNAQLATNFSFFHRLMLGNYVLGFYLIKFFFPFNLSAIYPYPSVSGEYLPQIYYLYLIITPLLIAIFVFLFMLIKTEKRIALFGALFFVLNIFLFMHIIPIQGRLVAADRYTYLAYFGWIVFVVFLAKNLYNNFEKLRRIVLICFSLIFVVFSFASSARCKVWKNEIDLFSDVIEKQPQWATAYSNRGTLYVKNNRPDLAILDYNKAIEVDSTFSLAYYNRALYFVTKSDFIRAISDCQKAYMFEPTFFDSYYLSGYSKNIIGDFKGAIIDLNKAIALNENSYLSFFNRGVAWKGLDSLVKAISDYSCALKIKPDFAEAYNSRGIVKYFQKDYKGSICDYDESIKINKNKNAYFNRGLSEIELQQFLKACEDFKTAQSLGYIKAADYLGKYCK